MKVEKVFWFSSNFPVDGCLGVVLGSDNVTGEHKGYIGMTFGMNEEKDKQIIAEHGQRLDPSIMKEISDYLDPKKK